MEAQDTVEHKPNIKQARARSALRPDDIEGVDGVWRGAHSGPEQAGVRDVGCLAIRRQHHAIRLHTGIPILSVYFAALLASMGQAAC